MQREELLREIGMLEWICHKYPPTLLILRGPKGRPFAKATRNPETSSSVHKLWSRIRLDSFKNNLGSG